MTDNVPTFDVQDIFPDAADPVDEALAQLREPHHLLAEALLTLRTAQDVSRAIDATAEEDDNGERPSAHFDRLDRHRRLIDEGAELARIAEVAGKLADGERQRYALTDADLDQADMETRTTPPGDLTRAYEPEAVNGLRFTAEVTGRHLGFVGGREWIWAPGVGYVDIAGSHAFTAPDGAAPGKGITYEFRGRVVSMDTEQALVVSDAGVGAVLPLTVVSLEPDE